jgi:hypothetical protein
VIVALVITPEGFPLAYEVMDGNRSDKTTLREFLDKIEELYGQARRVWLMDRGIPTEKLLEEIRAQRPNTYYLSGGDTAGSGEEVREAVAGSARKERDAVEVKLFAQDGESICAGEERTAAGERDRDATQEAGALAAQAARDAAELPEAGSVADPHWRGQDGGGPCLWVRQDSLAERW